MDSSCLALKIGNPSDSDKATFTRFTLPFAYNLKTTPSVTADDKKTAGDELFFELDPATDLSFIKRRKYFSREAALVLYNRASWFTLCSNWDKTAWGGDGVDIKLRGNSFRIKMLPPKLALFEAGDLVDSDSSSLLQTGFLMLDVYFPEQDNKPILDDLLQFNELFRYFGIPYDKHVESYEEALGKVPTEYHIIDDKDKDKKTNSKTIAGLIKRDEKDKLLSGYKEAYFSRWENLLGIPLSINNKTYQLFSEAWATDAKKWAYDIYKSPLEEHWQVYADNRAFVWTAALLNDGSNALQQSFAKKNKKENDWQARNYGHWLKLLNVDQAAETPEKTHREISQFERDWADERTYKRWEQSGSWYGYSYHCGAMLGSQSGVFGLQYFDTNVLLFYVRMTLFRFNTRLSSLMDSTHPSCLLKKNSELRLQFQHLRSEFSYFSILYQTPLLSNQQQSLEMYEYNKKYFEVDALFQDVKKEIDETHDLLEQMEAISLGKTANYIARWGIPFAAGGLITGLFGMSDFNLIEKCSGNGCFSWSNIFMQLGIVTLVTVGAYFLIPLFGTERNQKSRVNKHNKGDK